MPSGGVRFFCIPIKHSVALLNEGHPTPEPSLSFRNIIMDQVPWQAIALSPKYADTTIYNEWPLFVALVIEGVMIGTCPPNDH